jgi:hypothetical protein
VPTFSDLEEEQDMQHIRKRQEIHTKFLLENPIDEITSETLAQMGG